MANLLALFPNLSKSEWRCTSDGTVRYNCVAWAVWDIRRWWWPEPPRDDRLVFWPLYEKEETVPCFKRALAVRGYIPCETSDLEEGWEKVAIYVHDEDHDEPTHVARQLHSGAWASKLGDYEDIEHATLDAVWCRAYGTARHFMKRRRDAGQDQA